MSNLKIIECPRDAIQGIKAFVPTPTKIKYYNQLLKVGFPVLDCGSFVSPRAVPQMADTADVLKELDPCPDTDLCVIVANLRGAERALANERVDIIGFPFSISDTFQQKNTNKSTIEAFNVLEKIKNETNGTNKKLIVYISMAFGNPYKETWKIEDLIYWIKRVEELGIKTVNLSDTVGIAQENQITNVFTQATKNFPNLEFGAHFHTEYSKSFSKIQSAYDGGCRRFDGAIRGLGGCPFAQNELVGNMPTEKLITFTHKMQANHNLDSLQFESAYNAATAIFF